MNSHKKWPMIRMNSFYSKEKYHFCN